MKAIFLATICAALALPAAGWADANCKAYPKAEWIPEAAARAKIEAQGYAIRKFKVDGNCYEVDVTKDGKKLEIYVDAKTLDIVKTEND